MDIAKEEIDMSATVIDTAPLSSSGSVGSADGVAPAVLAAVILGVLCVIGVMFSLAVLMDRWNRRLNSARMSRSSGRSKKSTILDDMYPSAESEPPTIPSFSSGHHNC